MLRYWVEECVQFQIWVAGEEDPLSIASQQIYLVLRGVYGDDDDGLNQILFKDIIIIV